MWFRIGDTEPYSFVMRMDGECGSGLVIQSHTALLCEWAVDGTDSGSWQLVALNNRVLFKINLFKKTVSSLCHDALSLLCRRSCLQN